MSLADIDLYEVNEAFAVVPMALMEELKVAHDIVNVNGGGTAEEELSHLRCGCGGELFRLSLGARGGINYRDTDWAASLQKQAGRFDVIVDSAGGDGFGSLIDLTAPGGRIVFFGATTGNPKALDMRKSFFRQINLLGTTMGSPADFAGMTKFVDAHKITPVVDRVFPLDQADAALRHMEAAAQFGKIGLVI